MSHASSMRSCNRSVASAVNKRTMLYRCDFCEMLFSQDSYVKEHLKTHHLVEQNMKPKVGNHQCLFCPKSFPTKALHQSHMYKMHECEHCKKFVELNAVLNRTWTQGLWTWKLRLWAWQLRQQH